MGCARTHFRGGPWHSSPREALKFTKGLWDSISHPNVSTPANFANNLNFSIDRFMFDIVIPNSNLAISFKIRNSNALLNACESVNDKK